MKKVITISLIICIIVIATLIIFLNRQEKEEEVAENFYISDGGIYEKTDEINVNGINANIEKINTIKENYLKSMNTYFTLIPDKTYYLENQIDTKFREIEIYTKEKLNSNIEYFEISNDLELEDYYKTDMHWKQENLEEVIKTVQYELNIENEESMYEEKTLGSFYGTYYTKIKNNVEPDELKYLTNDSIENSVVYNEETKTNDKVYNTEKAEETGNKYDAFLSGASALEIVKNEKANTDKKLIIFRDSFGSSLAPLLIENYEEIVLIDLRYINHTVLEEYIDFSEYENQDVLFIYSSRVINKSGIFR